MEDVTPKNSKASKQMRMELVEKAMRNGVTNQLILAELVGVSQQCISNYVKEIVKQWATADNRPRSQRIALQVQRYEAIIEKALSAFACKPNVPGLLQQALTAMARIDSIYGLDAPKQHQHTLLGIISGMSEQEIIEAEIELEKSLGEEK
jgi:predicted transcriptional regulator